MAVSPSQSGGRDRIALDALPTPNAQVIFRSVADGGVLFSTEDEVYFGLNEVGAAIWENLPPATASFDDLCARLLQRYPDADPAQVRDDVAQLLGELADNGLVSWPAA